MADKVTGRRILVVDDEPDVRDMIVEVLSDHHVDLAGTFEEAKAKLAGGTYDLVVLDIMGVKGHELLDLYGQKFPCIMLTAHALTVESIQRSKSGHARLFLPKEELGELDVYVNKVISTRKPLWSWLVQKIDFRRWFGSDFVAEDALNLTMEEVMEDLSHTSRD